ncbi:endoribonuclease l-psp [Pyrrhoderma noxium]|uniref:Endoribonuclease l-psp n=1 Tax=Pyrrhoderma noxium TaxID=2282107 RepID=A0A286UT30_9AGAM|nr:endoribonuclease l-psp [Pyrrhoderma noxium]
MSISSVLTENAPIPNAPYSQGIKVGNLLFVSGCVPMDKDTMTIKGTTIEEQALQALTNLAAIVYAGGSSIDKIVKTTVFIKNMDEFARMNAVYAEFFKGHKPARSCVEVARLPLDVLFEIECIASLE